jgi:hypothetical protein
MHWILKASIITAITLLVSSSAYSIFFSDNDNINNQINEEETEDNDNQENNEDNEDSNDDNYNNNTGENNSNENIDIAHYGFVEAGTTVCCNSCAQVHIYLDEFYESKEYPFYYVSMPIENEKAAEYLTNYNIYGYPTVYFNGGYEVIMGVTDWKSEFKDKISTSLSRNASQVLVNVTAVWNENKDEIYVDIITENYEEDIYKGQLKVYLTEIVSTRWQGDQPYKYAFIDFIINENIEILSKQNNTISKTIDSSELDPENLMIFAVIFNSEKHIGYSFPPDEKSFDAYYVDAADSTFVVKDGNLPPMIGISSPTIGYLHYFGNAKRTSLSGRTILLGRTNIVVNALDDLSVQKVEFYIDGKLMETITEEPFEWKWHSFTIGEKTISVKAYDEEGKYSTANLDVWVFMKWKNPFLHLFN